LLFALLQQLIQLAIRAGKLSEFPSTSISSRTTLPLALLLAIPASDLLIRRPGVGSASRPLHALDIASRVHGAAEFVRVAFLQANGLPAHMAGRGTVIRFRRALDRLFHQRNRYLFEM
jgi:hypothetical protein